MSGAKPSLDDLLGEAEQPTLDDLLGDDEPQPLAATPAALLAAAPLQAPSPAPAKMHGPRLARKGRPSKIEHEVEKQVHKRISFAEVAPDMSLVDDIKLNDLEREFVRWFLILGKPLAAFRAANPQFKDTYQTSAPSRLLRRPNVRTAIDRIRNDRVEEIHFTLENILRELWSFDQANVFDYLIEDSAGKIVMKPFKDLTDLQKRNLKSLVIKTVKRKDPETEDIVEEQQVRYETYDRQKNQMDKARLQGFLKEHHVVDLGEALVKVLRERAGRHGRVINGETGAVES